MEINTPIFIVGNSRSGTTMLSQIIGNNSKVFSFNELHFFEYLVSEFELDNVLETHDIIDLFSKLIEIQRDGYLHQGKYSKYKSEALACIENFECKHMKAIGVYKLFLQNETSRHNKKYPCEQTPRNLFYLKEIIEHIPNAKIIIIVRDPRAVLNSQKGKWRLRFLGLNKIPLKETIRAKTNYHPVTISKIWSAGINTGLKHANHLQVFTLKFEDLLNEPEKKILELCKFIGIEYEADMINIPRWGSSREVTQNGIQGIDIGAVTGWRSSLISTEEVYICQKITLKEMEKLGYKQDIVSPNFFKLLLTTMTFPFHIIVALILNIGRTKNIVTAIKRRLMLI
jgi:omega-hydroxy-beta-dihydromenaquinone-9 sulfotransferase